MSHVIQYAGETSQLHLIFQDETFWLTQKQIAELFEVDRTVVTKHLKNIFSSEEIDEKSNVQKMHIPHSDKPVSFYNLDIVLSVGYRVNTKKGTQFRQWATKVLREKVLESYKHKEQEATLKMQELENVLHLVSSALKKEELSQSETVGLLYVITEYTNSWLLLQKYDEQQLQITETVATKESVYLDYLEAKNAILELKKNLQQKGEASDLFGMEREEMLEGILGSVYQSAFGEDAYSSVEEKAAHLLYFVIKNHPFSDGNKRIGAFLFILFLVKNNCLENAFGEKKINDNGLVALALLIAESDPKQKEILIKLVVRFLQEPESENL